MQDFKFKPVDPFAQKQEAEDFKFKPLDLSGLGQVKKKTRKILVPCEVCHVPGCMYEKEVPVDD